METKQDENKQAEEELPTTSKVVDTGKRVDVSDVKINTVKTMRRQHREGQPPRKTRPKPQSKGSKTKVSPTFVRPKEQKLTGKKVVPQKSAEGEETLEPAPKNGTNGSVIALPVETKEKLEVALPKVKPKEWDDSGDFAQMLAEEAPVQKLDIEVGSSFNARLIYMSKDSAFFALGPKHEGVMSMSELLDEDKNPTVKIGDTVKVYVVSIGDAILLSKKIGRHQADLEMLEDAKAKGIPVEGKVVGVNTGGIEVSMAGARAFCPLGQVDLHFVEDASSLVGQTLSFLVSQVGSKGRNIILTRRALLERERRESAKKRLETLEVGQQVSGKVVRLADFGAFVDLNGAEGLIPLSELGFSRASSVEDRVSIGDLVTVEVLRIEPDPKREGQTRIALSLKAAMPDPYETYGQYLVVGASLEGKVARLESFGAFVQLFDGIDGLIHISELSEQRVRDPSEVLKVGDPVTVRLLDVDFEKKRVSLSLRENVERQAKKVNGHGLKRGDKTNGVVERVERYGVFLKLANGQTALLPGSESGQPRGIDLNKPFPIGHELSVMVIEVDDRGRVRVSKIAHEKSEEQALVRSFSGNHGASLGTLGDLLKNRTQLRK